MVNPLDIYARATRRLPLTPAERALLRTGDQLALSALAGALLAVAQTIAAGGQQLTLATIGQVALYAAATALVTGLAKLFRARGDALGAAMASALDQAETRIPAHPLPLPSSGPLTARAYRGAPSGPIPAEQRAQLMAQARQTLASNPQLGAVTRAAMPAVAADGGATPAGGAPTGVDTQSGQIASSARSTAHQADEPPAEDEATGDGPGSQVTQVMAAVRPATDAWTN